MVDETSLLWLCARSWLAPRWPTGPANASGWPSSRPDSRVRDECLNINIFWSLTHARVVITDWKDEYNHHRRHSALGYQTRRATLPPVPRGTVDKFTGDGIMAVFGAPAALEDHAIRACLAALGVQEEAKRLAVEVQNGDGVDLKLRVGLNSGQVIAGEISSGAYGYTAVGEQVGMAQRMESVAPPGGVVLGASTARLVDGTAALGEPELVHIKGSDEPVRARRLLTVVAQPGIIGRSGTRFGWTPVGIAHCRCHFGSVR